MTERQIETLHALGNGRAFDANMTRGQASLLIEAWGGEQSWYAGSSRPAAAGGGAPRRRGGADRGNVIETANGRCMVKVSRNSASSPGAASPRYHEGRENVEVVRDEVTRDDVVRREVEAMNATLAPIGADVRAENVHNANDEPRWSITISPKDRSTDLEELGSYVLARIEDAHGTTLKGKFAAVHRDTDNPHIHLSCSVSSNVYLSQAKVERAVQDAMRSMARDRSRGQGVSR